MQFNKTFFPFIMLSFIGLAVYHITQRRSSLLPVDQLNDVHANQLPCEIKENLLFYLPVEMVMPGFILKQQYEEMVPQMK